MEFTLKNTLFRDDDGFEADQGNVALVDHPRSSTESKESHLSLYINHKEEKETIVTIIMYFQDKEKFNADFEIYVPRFKDHKILSQLMGFPEKQDLDETKEELMEFVKRRIERGPEELELRSLYPTLRELLNGNVLQYVQGDVKFLHKKFDSGKQENTWHFDVEKEYLAAIKHLQNQFRKARLNWYFKIRTDRVKPRSKGKNFFFYSPFTLSDVLEDKLQKYMEKMIVAENVYVPKFKESKFFKEMTERHSNCESDSLYGAALGIHYEFLSNNVEKEDKILDYDFDYLSNLEVPQKERAEVQYFKNLFHYDFASISLYI